MAFPRVVAHETGVEIVNEVGAVRVDGARHVIDVDAPATGFWELGASRSGVQQVVTIAKDELMLGHVAADDRRTLGDAVVSALRRAAGRAGARRGEVERQILQVRETPLVFSDPWIRASFVRSDAERFRPCRIAVALIEADDASGDATPEGAEALVDRLSRWRDLYAKDGKARRALTATLADHGDTASVYSLWGLRHVALSHRAASSLHVEVLGALGAHPSARWLVPHMQLVEAATPAELATAVGAVRPRLLGVPANVTAAHAFPELLAAIPIANLRCITPGLLLDILDLALEAKEDLEAPLARPPIPLPGDGAADGITFLATVGDLQREGEEMRHCVYTRRVLGQEGEAFFFHVGPRGEGATAQVDARGHVVEVRGPENRHNHHVDHAGRVLRAWGLRLRGIEHLLGKGPFPQRVAGPGEIPLGGSDAVLRVYQQACAVAPDDDGLLGKWLVANVARARRGELYLVLRPGTAGAGSLPVVVAVDRKGRALGHSSEVEAARTSRHWPAFA